MKQPASQFEHQGGQLTVHQRVIRARREALGITQEQMAFRSGLSVSGYRRLETGRRAGTRLSTLEKVAWCLGLEVRDLL